MSLWGRVGPQHGIGVLARLQRTCDLMTAAVPASAAGPPSRKGQSRGADRPRTAPVPMLLRGLSMLARLASLAAVVLVLIAVTSPAGALSERERADRIFDVAVRCALILDGVDPDPDEGRRMATDLLAKLESEVGDPRPVWDELRLQSPQCLSILNRPTVSAESKPERSPEPTSTGEQVEPPAAPTDGPAAAIQAQVEASPEVVTEAKPESPQLVPSLAAPTEPSFAQPAVPLEPAPAMPPVSASLAPSVAVEAPPSSAAPPTAAPVPPIRPKPTHPAEMTRAEPRPATTLT